MGGQYLQYKNADINYYTFGSGNKVLFCFHGYGEEGSSFLFLREILGEEFTLISIDFPFHGKTKWPEDSLFLPEDLKNILLALHPDKNATFSILAYSMGGRIALSLLPLLPEKIVRMALVAPDGLHVNFWYRLATQTALGKRLFKYTMYHPGWVITLLNIISAMNLLDKSLVKFVRGFLEAKKERILLYERWTALRKFKTDLPAVKNICSAEQKPLHILLGKNDQVISAKRARALSGNNYIQTRSIDAGHQLLRSKYAADIARLLTE